MAKKSGLGHGLGALISEANAESGSSSESMLPIDQITTNSLQPRKKFDDEELAELSDSIQQHGVLQPILVRKHGTKYEIVAGERRYQASKLAGLTEIPVCIKEINDEDVFQLALIENLQRTDLTPLEEAKGYRQLIKDHGLTQEQLAKVLSKSRSAIANTLRLMDLPEEVQDLMEQSLLTAGHARAILAVPDESGRIKLAQKVVAENLTVRQTENLAPLFSGNHAESRTRVHVPQSYKRAARHLRQILNTNVKVKQTRSKNKIEIEFKDDEELKSIISHIQSMEDESE